MNIIKTNKGVLAMADAMDYRLRKMEIAWELAKKVMPDHVTASGKWTADTFLPEAQAVLKEANEIVEAVFLGDKPSGSAPRTSTSMR